MADELSAAKGHGFKLCPFLYLRDKDTRRASCLCDTAFLRGFCFSPTRLLNGIWSYDTMSLYVLKKRMGSCR